MAADSESCKLNLDAEWQLNPDVLSLAPSILQARPSIDLFASRLNKQIDCYVSYWPDPEAYATDAFSLPRKKLDFFAFPPFSIITQVLGNVQREKCKGVVVVPRWLTQTQVWWPLLTRMLIAEPVLLKGRPLLRLPSHPHLRHPLLPSLQLMACRLSSDAIRRQDTPRARKT